MVAPLISAQALAERHRELRLFDARPGEKGLQAFTAGHLPGALHADLESHLSGPVQDPARGGRHPLPAVEVFAAQLTRWGLHPGDPAVIYDDAGGANAAARMWWMLRAMGHRQVQVLDGGLQAALHAGLTLSTASIDPEPNDLAPNEAKLVAPYPATEFTLPTVDIKEVDRARVDSQSVVIDVRAAFRYQGESEPIDPIAGHIPGAINVPLSENLDNNGCFQTAKQLRARYAPALEDASRCIVHCGSGVTACHTLLALHLAGFEGAELYVGSWSEWCRNARPRLP